MDAPKLIPPFNRETALAKVRKAEDAWNSQDPESVSMAYSADTQWRNREEFFVGREAVREFLTRKWAEELDYRLVKDLWAFGKNRIAVRFQYEYVNADGRWFRAYGNEQWQFDAEGLMERREASINDVPIEERDRKFHWPSPGPRPINHPGIEE